MTVDKQALARKIRELHPDIDAYSLELTVAFDKDKDAWYVRLSKDDNSMATHVENKDAAQCLEGTQCLYLGMQIGRFVKNYCQDPDGCTLHQCH